MNQSKIGDWNSLCCSRGGWTLYELQNMDKIGSWYHRTDWIANQGHRPTGRHIKIKLGLVKLVKGWGDPKIGNRFAILIR